MKGLQLLGTQRFFVSNRENGKKKKTKLLRKGQKCTVSVEEGVLNCYTGGALRYAVPVGPKGEFSSSSSTFFPPSFTSLTLACRDRAAVHLL